jgi:hypothetical protein
MCGQANIGLARRSLCEMLVDKSFTHRLVECLEREGYAKRKRLDMAGLELRIP